MYGVSFADMTWASTTNPNFFKSSQLKWPGNDAGNVFYGGETIASCPALYAFYLCEKFWKVPGDKINMVIVGNKDY